MSSAGEPRRYQRRVAGAALSVARRAKERTYTELVGVGGRWSSEAAAFVRPLARARARSVPPTQHSAAVSAFVLRWSRLLSFAAARAFATCLLPLPTSRAANVDGDPPDLSEVLADCAALPPLASRMRAALPVAQARFPARCTEV